MLKAGETISEITFSLGADLLNSLIPQVILMFFILSFFLQIKQVSPFIQPFYSKDLSYQEMQGLGLNMILMS